MQDLTMLRISEYFRKFLETLVEDVVINGEPFCTKEEWLRNYSEAEGVDYETLKRNLKDFIYTIRKWHEQHTKSSEMMARMLAKECLLSDTALQALFDQMSQKVETGANGHEYVDLGLPSGTLWATCNIGAAKPEEFGDYFAWGETSSKNTYNWSTYKYCNGESGNLTKYCNDSDYGNDGFTDNLTELQKNDDPATTNWGGGWQMPSCEQWGELLENTTHWWTTQDGVTGRLFASKKNYQTLFLPAAGDRWNDKLCGFGWGGYYWSNLLYTDYPGVAWKFYFSSGSYYMCYDERFCGRSVRAVLASRQNSPCRNMKTRNT